MGKIYRQLGIAERTMIQTQLEMGMKPAVVDKHCRLPDGLTVGLDPAEDRRRFHVSEGGIALIIPEMLGQQAHHLR